MYKAILVIIALFVPSISPAQEQTSNQVIRFRAGYFDADKQPIRLNPALPQVVLVQISIIGGNIFGRPTSSKALSRAVPIGEVSRLELKQVQKFFKPLAAPIVANDESRHGFVIKPKNTKVARLATVVFNPETMFGLGAASFRGESASENLLVVYFDRPCQLTGTINEVGFEATYDVKINKAGLNLIKVVQQVPYNKYHVTAAKMPKDPIHLAITPTVIQTNENKDSPTN